MNMKLGITQAELAKRVGVSDAYISFILSGKRRPSLGVACRMAEALELSVDQLINGLPTASISSNPH